MRKGLSNSEIIIVEKALAFLINGDRRGARKSNGSLWDAVWNSDFEKLPMWFRCFRVACMRKGRALEQKGDFRNAIRAYDTALHTDPGQWKAFWFAQARIFEYLMPNRGFVKSYIFIGLLKSNPWFIVKYSNIWRRECNMAMQGDTSQ